MIEIGYKFPHNGAEVILTAPADNDSIIVLCREPRDMRLPDQWITGRVYVDQLPRPESWDNGTYDEALYKAVEHFVDRSMLQFEPGHSNIVTRLVRVAIGVTDRLGALASMPKPEVIRQAALRYLHGQDGTGTPPLAEELATLADALGVPHADVEALA